MIGFNQTPLSDGSVVTLFASARADAPNGSYQIQLSNPVAVDPSGNSVPISGAAGTVVVQGLAGNTQPVIAPAF